MAKKPTRKKKTVQSPEMLRVSRHNCFMGHAKRMQIQLTGMLEADTLNEDARLTAQSMLDDVADLIVHLKERVDP